VSGEPKITINGIELSIAQAMTVRVAIESFASELRENGLGDDEHGRKMVENYTRAIDGIRAAIFR
jgi:hypothetical protein